MSSAQVFSPRQGSLSAVSGQSDPATRNLFVIAGAALGGLLIGCLSVLGIVAAVSASPSHDAPIGSMVFDGPHVVRAAPAAASEPASTPALASASDQSATALAPQPVAPVESQTVASAQEPKKTFSQAWPSALSTRTRHRLSSNQNIAGDNRQNVQVVYNTADSSRSSGNRQYDSWDNFFGFNHNN